MFPQLYQFLPLIGSPNGVQNWKFVESIVFEIIGGWGLVPNTFVQEGLKYRLDRQLVYHLNISVAADDVKRKPQQLRNSMS